MDAQASLFDGKFWQTAWITNDFDAALAVFVRDYGVPNWLQLRDYNIETAPGQHARVHIALARRGGVELEIIQPIGGQDHVYAQVLTAEPGLQIRFHHICFLYDTAEALERVREAAVAKGRPIVISGATESGIRYFYTDDRPTLGHHVEYITYPPGDFANLAAAIPVN